MRKVIFVVLELEYLFFFSTSEVWLLTESDTNCGGFIYFLFVYSTHSTFYTKDLYPGLRVNRACRKLRVGPATGTY